MQTPPTTTTHRPQPIDPDVGSWVSLGDYQVRINDEPNFRILVKDIFQHRVYHFTADQPDPLILDGGGNIGLSILYFKQVYPDARIIAFEPDPLVLPYLYDNLKRNNINDVKVVSSALAGRSGEGTLRSDGKYASSLIIPEDTGHEAHKTNRESDYAVTCVRLRDFLTEPVDFLKLNIEGAEWEVLSDSTDRLHNVREMVVEYHHLPGLPRTLHRILALLDSLGFDYLINDFDAETNPRSQPPFRLGPNTQYYLLIYAKRRE